MKMNNVTSPPIFEDIIDRVSKLIEENQLKYIEDTEEFALGLVTGIEAVLSYVRETNSIPQPRNVISVDGSMQLEIPLNYDDTE